MADSEADIDTNNETQTGQRKTQVNDSSTPGDRARQATSSAIPHFSTIYNAGNSFSQNQSFGNAGNSLPFAPSLPSCLMPEAFTGSGDFEDYLQQFNTCAQLSGWNQRGGEDLRPLYFALRLKGNALHFYSTLDEEHKHSFNDLVEAFRQNYTTSVDILKARLKAAKQQPGQDIATFLCDVRTLARRAYRFHPEIMEETVLTSFIEGLSNATLRWELRKSRPRSADEALTLALQLNSFLELEGINTNSSTANSLASKASNNQAVNSAMHANTVVFDEFVRALKRDSDFSQPSSEQYSNQRSRHHSRESNRGNEGRNRSYSRDDSRSHYRDDNRPQYRDKSKDSERGGYRNGYNRSRYDDRDQSRSRYGQRYNSSDRNDYRDKSVHFEDRKRDYSRDNQRRDNRNYDNSQRSKSPYHRNREEESRRDINAGSRNRYDPCRHCQRTNHSSAECKACFNCLRIGHISRECRAPKRSNLN